MITKRDVGYFEVARSMAKLSMHYKARIGAVIVNNGDIISAAFNVAKSHPLQAKYNVLRNISDRYSILHSLHAEMFAIIKADKQKLEGASIYIHRVPIGNGKERFLTCKPCAACSKALQDFGVKRIFCTDDNGFLEV